jgi:DNA-binding NtrC family response regulator
MFKVLVIDSSAEDTEWLRALLEEEGAQVVVCRDGTAARPVIEAHSDGFAAVFKLWDVSDPAFAETLALLRHRWPETPVVVTIQEFTPELAPKALALKVKGVLQKPLEAEKVIASYRGFLPREDSQMIARLRERIHGRSARLQAAPPYSSYRCS